MSKPLVVGVIPARYRSIRFPGKPLADLHGQPIVQWVHQQVSKVAQLDQVIVATDDERIVDVVEGFGGTAVMSSPSHVTGSDRVAEVVEQIDGDIIVNIQGDEPLIEPAMISQVTEPLLRDDSLQVSTLMHPITEAAEAIDEDVVKVVTNLADDVLFLSRSRIPFPKGPVSYEMHKHIGLYGFRRSALEAFAGWGPSPLEMTESVEMMRFLEHGWRVRAELTEHHTVAVDTPEDLDRVRELVAGMRERGGTYA